jgi:prepilin-type N-terminal cleavage/methylation domain-containing protein
MTSKQRRTESGFSLIELMVAMVVTLIVSGAIYGLLASGQSAFRREPELSDRQQNIRIALAMIEQDITNAGLNLGSFTQVFARNLNNDPDELEMMVADAACPPVLVCSYTYTGASPATVELMTPAPACFGLDALVPRPAAVAFRDASGRYDRTLVGPALDLGAPGVCGGTNLEGRRVNVATNAAPAGWQPVGGIPATITDPASGILLVPLDIVRYRVFDDADGVPSLWRSTTAGRSGALYENETDPPSDEWQLVARGIEDFQVRYGSVDGAGLEVEDDEPPVVAALNDYNPIVRRVRVMLQARATAANLAGSTVDPIGPDAPRGQLTTIVSPRNALLALQYSPNALNQWK